MVDGYRITEAGDGRITQDGRQRITEQAVIEEVRFGGPALRSRKKPKREPERQDPPQRAPDEPPATPRIPKPLPLLLDPVSLAEAEAALFAASERQAVKMGAELDAILRRRREQEDDEIVALLLTA